MLRNPAPHGPYLDARASRDGPPWPTSALGCRAVGVNFHLYQCWTLILTFKRQAASLPAPLPRSPVRGPCRGQTTLSRPARRPGEPQYGSHRAGAGSPRTRCRGCAGNANCVPRPAVGQAPVLVRWPASLQGSRSRTRDTGAARLLPPGTSPASLSGTASADLVRWNRPAAQFTQCPRLVHEPSLCAAVSPDVPSWDHRRSGCRNGGIPLRLRPDLRVRAVGHRMLRPPRSTERTRRTAIFPCASSPDYGACPTRSGRRTGLPGGWIRHHATETRLSTHRVRLA